MERQGVSTIVSVIILVAIVTAMAGAVAVFFQSALEDVQDGPDVGFENALEVVHVSCIGHEMRLTVRNAGDEAVDASSARAYLYDGNGDLLQVTEEQDFSGKRFEDPDGIDTMVFTVTDAKPLTDEMPFEVAFADEGVAGVCQPEYDTWMVAGWSFDATEQNGTHVFDLVGGNTGNVEGGATTGVDGISGTGIYFDGIADGTDDHVVTQNTVAIPQQYTLSTWLKGDFDEQSTENIYVFGWNSKIGLALSSGSDGSPRGGILIRNAADTGYHSVWSGTNVLDGEWHHVAATVDRNTLEVDVYIDGALDTDTTIPDHYSTSRRIVLGGWSTSYGTFNGTLDDSRLYNRSLSAEAAAMDAVALG